MSRSAIRIAAVDALINATAAGANVFRSRNQPLTDQELPAIVVFMGPEGISETFANVSDKVIEAELRCVVKAKADVAFDDTVDNLHQQIVDILDGSRLSGSALACEYQGVDDEPEIDDSTETNIASLPMVFAVHYE